MTLIFESPTKANRIYESHTWLVVIDSAAHAQVTFMWYTNMYVVIIICVHCDKQPRELLMTQASTSLNFIMSIIVLMNAEEM